MSATSHFRNLLLGILFIPGLASFAQEESTTVAPANSNLNSDWARMMYGLRNAAPHPRLPVSSDPIPRHRPKACSAMT